MSNFHITLEEEYILFHLQGAQASEVSMLNMSSGGFHMDHSLFYFIMYLFFEWESTFSSLETHALFPRLFEFLILTGNFNRKVQHIMPTDY